MSFNNLPGVQIKTLDGGLTVRRTPTTKSLLILGTSASGPADTPYQVTDRDVAVSLFGTDGSLIRALEEASVYCDNIHLMRIGTSPAQLAGIGADTGNVAGYAVEFGERSETAADRYKVWYMNGVLYVWLDGTLVYSNDADLGNVLDVGNVNVIGVATGGLVLAAKTAGAGTIASAAAAITGTNTAFTDELAIGDYIEGPSGELRKVTLITDATHATVDAAFTGNIAPTTAYKIVKGATIKTPDGALTLTDAAALATVGTKTKPVLTKAVIGLDMTNRELYVAQQKALNLLQTYPVQGVYSPSSTIDAPNVAFYNSLDPLTAVNNPATNSNALDWLQTVKDDYGQVTFHWASETKDSNGKAVPAAVFINRADRVSKGYSEVNFGYQLARFAEQQEEELGGCIAFIGTAGPKGFDLPHIRDWVGFLPKYDAVTGNAVVSGKGLLGIPALVGCAAAKLNPLCSDYAIGFRGPGLFKTGSTEIDGDVETDRNGYPVDLGAYLHVAGDFGLIANGVGQYVGNIIGIVAGMCQALDEKSSPTNKPIRMVRQLYRASLTQLDALTQANVQMLRFKRVGDPPYLLHGMTAANDQSDWTNILRMRIKFLVVSKLFEQGDRFIGESTADGMQLQAMQTALDSELQNLQKRGYIQRYRFAVSTTQADQRIGRAFIDVSFMPADELIQLRATVSISRQ